MNLSTDDCDMIVTTVNMYDKTSLLSAITTGILLIIAALFCTTGLYCNLLPDRFRIWNEYHATKAIITESSIDTWSATYAGFDIIHTREPNA